MHFTFDVFHDNPTYIPSVIETLYYLNRATTFSKSSLLVKYGKDPPISVQNLEASNHDTCLCVFL